MKTVIVIVAVFVLVSGVYAGALDAITEGFNPGGGQAVAISVKSVKSVDTGYLWSGYQGNLWGLNLLDGKGRYGQCFYAAPSPRRKMRQPELRGRPGAEPPYDLSFSIQLSCFSPYLCMAVKMTRPGRIRIRLSIHAVSLPA